MLPESCDVAVIGAGPYGLAVAAHLMDANVATRVFGQPMSSWRANMPKGMKLRSSRIATNISDPQGRYSLDAYAHRLGLLQQEPLPLEHFVSYGEWFQRVAVPDADTRNVVRVEDVDGGFCLVVDDGTAVLASRVVVATGVANQDYRPPVFQGLPPALVSHVCEHADLDAMRGLHVAVVGRGQGACESAALLREAGCKVELICRGNIRWLDATEGVTLPSDGPALPRRMWVPRAAVGPFPLNWLNEYPGMVYRAPAFVRDRINRRSLRAAPADWLMPRFVGVRVHARRQIVRAEAKGNKVAVTLDNGTHVFEHVLLATGYRVDISQLGFWSPQLARTIACIHGSPVLADGFESSVPGLHFVGASAIASYGPLMGFVAGSGYAARSVTQALLAARAKRAGRMTKGRGLHAGVAEPAARH
jgi:cation diffusion facilitator CzcD-associated flavoprotein CzcO